MSRLRLGQLDYINCLPVYHALEEGLLPLEAELVKGPPTVLNRLFLSGRLDVTPLSSIEYARNEDKCIILPDLSISADGRVMSILLFSKVPVTELEGKKVCLTDSSATGVVLLKVLFDHYYHVDVDFETSAPELNTMMERADGALLIGDNAMQAHQHVKERHMPYYVTDLGETWKQFSGAKMVYAVWVVRKAYAGSDAAAVDCLSNALVNAKKIGYSQFTAVAAKAQRRSGLPLPVVEDYFQTIKHEFSEDDRKALLSFYDYAYKSGLIEDRVKLRVWGETGA
ncbi:menaquinone biosynthesis protein [Pelotomaculum terephthalicicum JT]|uniref:menaquinone biosynthetic enzyme MqnA/MqnD family protein n=1 Tax=Pelotomaculum TaxID=191373 RepID=UPI0009CC0551|nr:MULTISPECIES: menaquinone biosynthesis protein [Pelotomaculum]MCG9966469.1 menaquinone biosynthesis protein [Pelotomaculum terephthalicicum JT]OPX85966.1 MAG: Chorismate dehydratase [Pelotomaculum sp. PtaB.Bin117]OPY63390.1 MAG: Chorismate dehydratase [Pelotomaculum sp. PtaU1.Bin065]